jgi:hypothetical protein
MREVLRALAMTLWPRERASSAMNLPKPLEAAVMNHTGVWEDMVDGLSVLGVIGDVVELGSGNAV